MDNSKTNCSKCGSDQTQSFSMAHQTGTVSGLVVGAGLTGQDRVGVGAGFSKTKTGIAKITAPPTKPSSSGDSAVFIILLVVGFNVLFAIAYFFLSFFLPSVTSAFVSIAISAVVTIAAGVYGATRKKSGNGSEERRFEIAMKKWQASWICLRCGNTFTVR